jgi:hypothetical protein
VVRLLRDPALRGQMREQGVALVARRADRRVWMQHTEGISGRLAGF